MQMEKYFVYVIIFKDEINNTGGSIIKYTDTINPIPENNGTMHLFDSDLNEILPAIEYIMHFPRNIYDLYDMDENLMASSHDTPHFIIPVPESFALKFSSKFMLKPTIFILENNCNEEIKNICNKHQPLLGTYYMHELSEELIKEHWDILWKNNKSDDFQKVRDIDIHYKLENEYLKALPVLFLSRQYGETNDTLSEVYNSTDIEEKCADIQRKNIARLNTLIAMGNKGITTWDNQASKLYDSIIMTELSKFNVSIVITFPGLSGLQTKYGVSADELSENEKRVIRIMGVHRAIARGGILIELPCASKELFKKYDELEKRCKDGTNNKYVWKALTDLGRLLGSHFNRFQIEVLRRAKDITVFSDFPIGLAILEGEEVPLQCYKKISYRPLTPLTRGLQIELLKSKQIYLGKKCKIAMAECIIDNDENRSVYNMSESVHKMLNNMTNKYEGLSVVHEQTYSIDSIKKFIRDNSDADILYISAHGNYSRKHNLAGIMVGDEFWMGSEDMGVPPIVILSACHTSPRGIGAVNIADMFIRNGAIAVLGTFIPVNAERNAILMTRLFTYILEAQHGSKQYKTLDDAWSGIVSSNAIHELLKSSDSFKEWMLGKNSNGKTRMVEFQLERCVNRLRSTHIYTDTIEIIKEMLEEEDMQGKFGDILDMKNFFPESFFYQLIGYPENIFLYNDIFEKVYNKNIPHE